MCFCLFFGGVVAARFCFYLFFFIESVKISLGNKEDKNHKNRTGFYWDFSYDSNANLKGCI